MQKIIRKDILKEALNDYIYLINKSYSNKAILKLIGDRYLLNRNERIILQRGVCTEKDAIIRNNKQTMKVTNTTLYVDFYNVIFTICNYLYGRLLFIGIDGYLRDCGEVFNYTKVNQSLFSQALDLLLLSLNYLHPNYTNFILDAPMAYSGNLSKKINQLIDSKKLNACAYTKKSPDHELMSIPEGIIATSDSVIIQNSSVKVFDMSYNILHHQFNASFLNVKELL